MTSRGASLADHRAQELRHGERLQLDVGLDEDRTVGAQRERRAQRLLARRDAARDRDDLGGHALLLHADRFLDGDLVEGIHRHLDVGGVDAAAVGLHPDLHVVIDDALDGHEDFHGGLTAGKEEIIPCRRRTPARRRGRPFAILCRPRARRPRWRRRSPRPFPSPVTDALRRPGARALGLRRGRAVAAVGIAVRRPAAFHRLRPAARTEALARPLRQMRGRLDAPAAGPVRRDVRRGRDAAQRRPRDRARVRSVPRHAVRALHHRGRHLPSRHARRNPRGQHGAPRPRRVPRERHGNDGRGHAADPAAPHRQRDAAPSRARRRVLHPARRQRGRRAVAARRPAAFHRLPERRRFLLDDPRAGAPDAVPLRGAARRVLRARRDAATVANRRQPSRPRSGRRCRSRARRISCCWPA